MADKLKFRDGLRVVPYYGGPSLRSWRIDVRGKSGIDVSDEVFADDAKLGNALAGLSSVHAVRALA